MIDGKEYIEKRMGKKRNSNGFDKRLEDARKGGRPKRTLKVINEELKKAGYEPATFDDIKSAYLYLLQLPVEEIKGLVNKKDTPVMIKIVAKALGNKKGFDIIEKMLDRAIGKAVQQIEQNIKTEDITKPEPKNKKLLKDLGI